MKCKTKNCTNECVCNAPYECQVCNEARLDKYKLDKEVERWKKAYETCHDERMEINSQMLKRIENLKEAFKKPHENQIRTLKYEIAIEMGKQLQETCRENKTLKKRIENLKEAVEMVRSYEPKDEHDGWIKDVCGIALERDKELMK